jgi:hypothetical protein
VFEGDCGGEENGDVRELLNSPDFEFVDKEGETFTEVGRIDGVVEGEGKALLFSAVFDFLFL